MERADQQQVKKRKSELDEKESQILQNHNNGRREDGSYSSTRNQPQYPTIGYQTTSGSKPMSGMNNPVDQWDKNQGIDPSVRREIYQLAQYIAQYTVKRELAKYNSEVTIPLWKIMKNQKETRDKQNYKQNYALNKVSFRLQEVENRGMSFDLNENKDIYHSNSLPIVSKPPSLNLQPPSTGIHDGASDNYQPDAHHQTHNIQDAGRDIEAMDKELDRQKKRRKKIYVYLNRETIFCKISVITNQVVLF